jgi:hypothetical protein
MTDVMKELFGGDTDHDQARRFAQDVAALLGSRVAVNESIILDEPYCPFKMSCHSREFHCFLFISDVAYRFTAKPRPKTPFAEDFIVSFKEPYPVSGVSFLEPKLSRMFGVSVFRQRSSSDDVVPTAFSKRIVSCLRKLPLKRMQRVRFSPVHLSVVGTFDSPRSCAKRVTPFHKLMAVANKEAQERNKEFLG